MRINPIMIVALIALASMIVIPGNAMTTGYQGDIYYGQKMSAGFPTVSELNATCAAYYPGSKGLYYDKPQWWVGRTLPTGKVGYDAYSAWRAQGENYTVVINVTDSLDYYGWAMTCFTGSGSTTDYTDYKAWWRFRSGNPILVPGISFSGSPTSGNNPLSVAFSANSNQTNAWYRWTFGDGTSTNTTGNTYTHQYQNPGIYSVRLDTYSSTYGYYNLTKTDYITVLNPSGMIVNLDVKDASTGVFLQDVSTGIKNTTSGVWRNATGVPWGSVYFDTSDPGYLYPLSLNQTLILAASATGYNSGSVTFNIPYNEYRATINLVKSGITNATGTGALSVSAVRNKDGRPIAGVSVVLDTGNVAVTNIAGNAMFYNVTAGTRYISATDTSGLYQPAQKTTTVSAGGTSMETIQMVLLGETPVPTFVAPTQTGDVLVDTNGDGIGDTASSVVGNYTPGQLNQKGSSGLMEMMGFLINLWPLVFLFGFLKFMRMCME